MSDPAVFSGLPAPLARALTRRGFTALTKIQSAVLSEELRGRDLRISSRTGSGKTVALGLAVAHAVSAHQKQPTASLCAHPSVLLVAPTRELAAQVGKELAWLYAELGSVCVVTGGTSTSEERRALSRGPSVVVGTPGRLCDHLERGALDLGRAGAIVLDEADQMLDLGFREALETLLKALPEGCQKHLVSATFPRGVLNLAARYQRNALEVTGDTAAEAHADITHVAHLVHPRERYDALVNVLLLDPELRTLIFVRTRSDAADVATRLIHDGFRAGVLSGELAQAERTRMLDGFRAGTLAILVCTDVASRGIDVPEVARVIHAELPDNGEVLTHRSGRTGRAGRKGTSIMLVPAPQYRFAENLLRAANVIADLLPAPSARDVRRRCDARLLEELTSAPGAAAESTEESAERPEESAERPAKRPRKLALELISKLGAEAAVEALLRRLEAQGPCEPRVLSELSIERAGQRVAPRSTWPQRARDRAPRSGPARNSRGVPPRAQRR